MQIISSCRVCQNKSLVRFFDLGKQPPANWLLKNPNEKEEFYPLSLSFCQNCSLVQLNETVDPKKLFSKYVWVTGTAKATREYAEVFCKELITRTPSATGGYVLDVGSNDGTFLQPFLREGFKVLGVDPAENIVKTANDKGIETLCRFFSAQTAQEIVEKYGKAKMVFARNVLPHVANTRDFTDGLSICLADDGILAVEVHYGGKILEELHYDSIYHEHLCYFTLKTLEHLLKDFGLYVFDIMESPISGGSIVVYASKNKEKEKSEKVKAYYALEESKGLNSLQSWQEFAKRSYLHRDKFKTLLKELSDKGELIVGYGASARSSTLLNFCQIDSSIIKYIADQNPLKQGLFTAGSHIPIENPEKIFASDNTNRKLPTVVVILAWNFAKEIMDVLRDKYGYKGKVVMPLPGEPRIEKI